VLDALRPWEAVGVRRMFGASALLRETGDGARLTPGSVPGRHRKSGGKTAKGGRIFHSISTRTPKPLRR